MSSGPGVGRPGSSPGPAAPKPASCPLGAPFHVKGQADVKLDFLKVDRVRARAFWKMPGSEDAPGESRIPRRFHLLDGCRVLEQAS